ncbi:3115_t:CDS:2, partial [Cetraspora pellucida]
PNIRDHEYDDRNPNRRGRYHPHDNSGQRDYFSHHRMYRYRESFDDWDFRTIPRSRERKRPEHDRPRLERDRERNDRDRNASIPRERQLSRVGPSRECTNQYAIHNMGGFDYQELETRQKFSFGFSKDFERDELQGIGPTYGNWRNRNRSTSPSPRSSVTSSSSFTRHRTRSPVPKLDITKSEEPTNFSPTNIHSRSKPPSIESATSPHHFDIEQTSVFMRLQNHDEKSSIDDNSLSYREKMRCTPEFRAEETNFSTESIQEVENPSQSNVGNEKGGWTGWHSLERREVDQNQRMEESKLISRSQERDINYKEQEQRQPYSQKNDANTSLEESDAQFEKFRNQITDSDGEHTISHIEINNVVIHPSTAICDTVQNPTNENTNTDDINTRIIEVPDLDDVSISQQIKNEEFSNSGEERPKFQSLFEELEYVEGQIDIWEGLRDKKLEQIEKKRKFQTDQKAIKRLKRDTAKISKSSKKDNVNNSQKVSPKSMSSIAYRRKKVENTSTSAHRQGLKAIIKGQTSESSTINTRNKDICKNSLLDRWFNNQKREHNDDSLDESKDNLFSRFQRKFQQGTRKERELREDYESRIRSKALDDDYSDSSIRGDELIKSVKGKSVERRNAKSKGKQRADSIPENSTTTGFAVRYPVRTTRSRRCSDYVTTDQEFAEILQKLGAEDQKQGQEQQRGESSRAHIPPLPIDVSGQKASNFVDNSGRVLDPVEFYGHNNPLGSNWTEDEQNQFEKLFKITPKDFNKIADKMAHKTAGDCAIFYKHLKTARTKSGDIDEKKRQIYNRLHDMKVKPKKRGQKRAMRGRNRTNFSSNQVPSLTRAIDTIEQSIVRDMDSAEKPDVLLQVSQLQRPKLEGSSSSEITKETSINHILDQEVGQAALALTLMSRQFPIESTEKSSEQTLSKVKTLINKTEGHTAQSCNDFRSRHIQVDGCQSTLSIGSLLNPSEEIDSSSFTNWFDCLEEEEQGLGNK